MVEAAPTGYAIRVALYVVKNRRTISVPKSPDRVPARKGVSKGHTSRLEHCFLSLGQLISLAAYGPPDLCGAPRSGVAGARQYLPIGDCVAHMLWRWRCPARRYTALEPS